MELAVLLALAELRLMLPWLLGVPTLLKGRVGLFMLGIFVPLRWAVGGLGPGRD